jgi:hypothetical protein
LISKLREANFWVWISNRPKALVIISIALFIVANISAISTISVETMSLTDIVGSKGGIWSIVKDCCSIEAEGEEGEVGGVSKGETGSSES